MPVADPRTSTPPVIASSHRITVQPVRPTASVEWPTLRPPTSVRNDEALISDAFHACRAAGLVEELENLNHALFVRHHLEVYSAGLLGDLLENRRALLAPDEDRVDGNAE